MAGMASNEDYSWKEDGDQHCENLNSLTLEQSTDDILRKHVESISSDFTYFRPPKSSCSRATEQCDQQSPSAAQSNSEDGGNCCGGNLSVYKNNKSQNEKDSREVSTKENSVILGASTVIPPITVNAAVSSALATTEVKGLSMSVANAGSHVLLTSSAESPSTSDSKVGSPLLVSSKADGTFVPVSESIISSPKISDQFDVGYVNSMSPVKLPSNLCNQNDTARLGPTQMSTAPDLLSELVNNTIHNSSCTSEKSETILSPQRDKVQNSSLILSSPVIKVNIAMLLDSDEIENMKGTPQKSAHHVDRPLPKLKLMKDVITNSQDSHKVRPLPKLKAMKNVISNCCNSHLRIVSATSNADAFINDKDSDIKISSVSSMTSVTKKTTFSRQENADTNVSRSTFQTMSPSVQSIKYFTNKYNGKSVPMKTNFGTKNISKQKKSSISQRQVLEVKPPKMMDPLKNRSQSFSNNVITRHTILGKSLNSITDIKVSTSALDIPVSCIGNSNIPSNSLQKPGLTWSAVPNGKNNGDSVEEEYEIDMFPKARFKLVTSTKKDNNSNNILPSGKLDPVSRLTRENIIEINTKNIKKSFAKFTLLKKQPNPDEKCNVVPDVEMFSVDDHFKNCKVGPLIPQTNPKLAKNLCHLKSSSSLSSLDDSFEGKLFIDCDTVGRHPPDGNGDEESTGHKSELEVNAVTEASDNQRYSTEKSVSNDIHRCEEYQSNLEAVGLQRDCVAFCEKQQEYSQKIIGLKETQQSSVQMKGKKTGKLQNSVQMKGKETSKLQMQMKGKETSKLQNSVQSKKWQETMELQEKIVFANYAERCQDLEHLDCEQSTKEQQKNSSSIEKLCDAALVNSRKWGCLPPNNQWQVCSQSRQTERNRMLSIKQTISSENSDHFNNHILNSATSSYSDYSECLSHKSTSHTPSQFVLDQSCNSKSHLNCSQKTDLCSVALPYSNDVASHKHSTPCCDVFMTPIIGTTPVSSTNLIVHQSKAESHSKSIPQSNCTSCNHSRISRSCAIKSQSYNSSQFPGPIVCCGVTPKPTANNHDSNSSQCIGQPQSVSFQGTRHLPLQAYSPGNSQAHSPLQPPVSQSAALVLQAAALQLTAFQCGQQSNSSKQILNQMQANGGVDYQKSDFGKVKEQGFIRALVKESRSKKRRRKKIHKIHPREKTIDLIPHYMMSSAILKYNVKQKQLPNEKLKIEQSARRGSLIVNLMGNPNLNIKIGKKSHVSGKSLTPAHSENTEKFFDRESLSKRKEIDSQPDLANDEAGTHALPVRTVPQETNSKDYASKESLFPSSKTPESMKHCISPVVVTTSKTSVCSSTLKIIKNNYSNTPNRGPRISPHSTPKVLSTEGSFEEHDTTVDIISDVIDGEPSTLFSLTRTKNQIEAGDICEVVSNKKLQTLLYDDSLSKIVDNINVEIEKATKCVSATSKKKVKALDYKEFKMPILESVGADQLPPVQLKLLRFIFQHDMHPPTVHLSKLAKMIGKPWKCVRDWFVEARQCYKKAGLLHRNKPLESCSHCNRSLRNGEPALLHLFDEEHVKSALGEFYLGDKSEEEVQLFWEEKSQGENKQSAANDAPPVERRLTVKKTIFSPVSGLKKSTQSNGSVATASTHDVVFQQSVKASKLSICSERATGTLKSEGSLNIDRKLLVIQGKKGALSDVETTLAQSCSPLKVRMVNVVPTQTTTSVTRIKESTPLQSNTSCEVVETNAVQRNVDGETDARSVLTVGNDALRTASNQVTRQGDLTPTVEDMKQSPTINTGVTPITCPGIMSQQDPFSGHCMVLPRIKSIGNVTKERDLGTATKCGRSRQSGKAFLSIQVGDKVQSSHLPSQNIVSNADSSAVQDVKLEPNDIGLPTGNGEGKIEETVDTKHKAHITKLELGGAIGNNDTASVEIPPPRPLPTAVVLNPTSSQRFRRRIQDQVHDLKSTIIGYKCPLCLKIFASEWYLVRHSLEHQTFNCFHCPEKFPNEIVLRAHLLSHLTSTLSTDQTDALRCRSCLLSVCRCPDAKVGPSAPMPCDGGVAPTMPPSARRPQVARRSKKTFITKPCSGPNDHLKVTLSEYLEMNKGIKRMSALAKKRSSSPDKLIFLKPVVKNSRKTGRRFADTTCDQRSEVKKNEDSIFEACKDYTKRRCDLCGESFDKRSQLDEHMFLHRLKSRKRRGTKRSVEDETENAKRRCITLDNEADCEQDDVLMNQPFVEAHDSVLSDLTSPFVEAHNSVLSDPTSHTIPCEDQIDPLEEEDTSPKYWFRCFYCKKMMRRERELRRHLKFHCRSAPQSYLRKALADHSTLIAFAKSGAGKLYDLVHPETNEVLDCLEEADKDHQPSVSKSLGKLVSKCTFCGMKFERVREVRKHLQTTCHKISKAVRKKITQGATLEEVGAVELCNDTLLQKIYEHGLPKLDYTDSPELHDLASGENYDDASNRINKDSDNTGARSTKTKTCTACGKSFQSQLCFDIHGYECSYKEDKISSICKYNTRSTRSTGPREHEECLPVADSTNNDIPTKPSDNYELSQDVECNEAQSQDIVEDAQEHPTNNGIFNESQPYDDDEDSREQPIITFLPCASALTRGETETSDLATSLALPKISAVGRRTKRKRSRKRLTMTKRRRVIPHQRSTPDCILEQLTIADDSDYSEQFCPAETSDTANIVPEASNRCDIQAGLPCRRSFDLIDEVMEECSGPDNEVQLADTNTTKNKNVGCVVQDDLINIRHVGDTAAVLSDQMEGDSCLTNVYGLDEERENKDMDDDAKAADSKQSVTENNKAIVDDATDSENGMMGKDEKAVDDSSAADSENSVMDDHEETVDDSSSTDSADNATSVMDDGKTAHDSSATDSDKSVRKDEKTAHDRSATDSIKSVMKDVKTAHDSTATDSDKNVRKDEETAHDRSATDSNKSVMKDEKSAHDSSASDSNKSVMEDEKTAHDNSATDSNKSVMKDEETAHDSSATDSNKSMMEEDENAIDDCSASDSKEEVIKDVCKAIDDCGATDKKLEIMDNTEKALDCRAADNEREMMNSNVRAFERSLSDTEHIVEENNAKVKGCGAKDSKHDVISTDQITVRSTASGSDHSTIINDVKAVEGTPSDCEHKEDDEDQHETSLSSYLPGSDTDINEVTEVIGSGTRGNCAGPKEAQEGIGNSSSLNEVDFSFKIKNSNSSENKESSHIVLPVTLKHCSEAAGTESSLFVRHRSDVITCKLDSEIPMEKESDLMIPKMSPIYDDESAMMNASSYVVEDLKEEDFLSMDGGLVLLEASFNDDGDMMECVSLDSSDCEELTTGDYCPATNNDCGPEAMRVDAEQRCPGTEVVAAAAVPLPHGFSRPHDRVACEASSTAAVVPGDCLLQGVAARLLPEDGTSSSDDCELLEDGGGGTIDCIVETVAVRDDTLA